MKIEIQNPESLFSLLEMAYLKSVLYAPPELRIDLPSNHLGIRFVYMTVYEWERHYSDYLKVKLQIQMADLDRWLLSYSKYELPTFEYYITYCVIDKGGRYDFTVRRYGNEERKSEAWFRNASVHQKVNIDVVLKYSMYMGTPFNFKSYSHTYLD